MASPIVFYDVTCNNEGITHDSQRAVSVNTWRVRYALNIKGIPYKTVWLDYAEIKETIKALGAEPSGTSRSGEPRYTVPTIYDPSTKRTVTDSYKILDYLDAQYPDTPALLPPGTRALQQAFIQNVTTPLALTLFPVLVLDMLPMITETGAPVWRAMAEDMVGARLEQIVPQGEQRAGTIEAFLARLDAVGKAMGANGDGAVFLTGDAPSGADCDLAAWLTLWERATAKKEGALWKQIMEVSTWCQWAINALVEHRIIAPVLVNSRIRRLAGDLGEDFWRGGPRRRAVDAVPTISWDGKMMKAGIRRVGNPVRIQRGSDEEKIHV